MGLFKKKNDGEREFARLTDEAMKAKDAGMLYTSLQKRREATEVARNMPAWKCFGKHNEMILLGWHIGKGLEARTAAQASMEYPAEYRQLSVELQKKLRFNAYQESISYSILWAETFDEALQLSKKLADWFPSAESMGRFNQLVDFQEKNTNWGKVQRMFAHTMYSRESPEKDAGNHAAGMSVLECILANAEKPGYMLEYEEYVDTLDDYCVLSLMYLQSLLPKWARTQQGDPAQELGIVFEGPVKYLADFMPDCLPKDRELFTAYFDALGNFPFMPYVPGYERLAGFFGG